MDVTLKELREERHKKVMEGQAILELADKENDRALTEEEKTQVDGLLEETRELSEKIGAAEDTDRRKAMGDAVALMSKPEPRLVPPRTPKTEGPPVSTATRAVVRPPLRSERRCVAFRGAEGEEKAHRAGMWFKAQLLGDEYARAWCHDHMEKRILQTNVNTAAGYLVAPEFESAIITNREMWGVARQFADVMPMSSDTLSIPRYSSGPAGVWTSEATGLTAADPVFDQVNLTAKKLSRLTRVSSEMLEDSAIDLADWLADDMALAFAEAEDDALFNGDLTSTFGGIHGIAQQFDDDNTLQGAVDAVTANADTFAELLVADLTTMMGELPEYALTNAGFYISQLGFAVALERIAHSAGGATVNTFQERLQRVFMGYPVRVSQKMPAVATTLDNTAMVLFGDLKRAVVLGDRRQIRIQILQERYADTDEIGIKATERIDIVAHGAGTTTVAGPIVALIGVA